MCVCWGPGLVLRGLVLRGRGAEVACPLAHQQEKLQSGALCHTSCGASCWDSRSLSSFAAAAPPPRLEPFPWA